MIHPLNHKAHLERKALHDSSVMVQWTTAYRSYLKLYTGSLNYNCVLGSFFFKKKKKKLCVVHGSIVFCSLCVQCLKLLGPHLCLARASLSCSRVDNTVFWSKVDLGEIRMAVWMQDWTLITSSLDLHQFDSVDFFFIFRLAWLASKLSLHQRMPSRARKIWCLLSLKQFCFLSS